MSRSERETRPSPKWMSPATSPPRMHNIPVAILHLRSHYPGLLSLFLNFAQHAAAALHISFSQPAFLPTQRSLWTVPASPFIYKKKQENFDRRTHRRAMKLWDAESETVTAFFEYLKKHVVGGVGMRFVRWERAPVGIGSSLYDQVHRAFTQTQRSETERLQAAQQKALRAAMKSTNTKGRHKSNGRSAATNVSPTSPIASKSIDSNIVRTSSISEQQTVKTSQQHGVL